MSETALAAARTAFDRIMVEPAPADLWQLQKALLVIGGESAARARAVARAFHTCLRNLESKSASRAASRWGAVLGTAAVGSVSASEMLARQEGALEGLLQSGVPAMLEVGSALKSAQAWEIEAGLIYDELAWFLYDELWDVSATARPELSPTERRDQIDLLLDPLIDSAVSDSDRAGLIVHVFQAVLAARLLPRCSTSCRATRGRRLPTDRPARPDILHIGGAATSRARVAHSARTDPTPRPTCRRPMDTTRPSGQRRPDVRSHPTRTA